MREQSLSVGMASAYFAAMRGGGEHYTLYLSNELAQMGYDITIICGKRIFHHSRPLSDRFRMQYVPQLYSLREWGMRGIRLISAGAAFVHHHQYAFYCYRNFLRDHDFDLIHTHDPASLHAAVKIKKKYGIAVASTFHGPPSPRDIKDAKSADAILPVSEEIKLSFENYGMGNVYDAVPGGVDLSHFKQLNKEECKELLGLNGRMILFVGRLIPTKNLSTLLCAFKGVHSEIDDAKLLIVGDGVLGVHLRKTTEKLNLADNVEFTGAVTHQDLPLYYNAADVFVLPSLSESFPLACLEAASCGVPVAISSGAKAFIEAFGGEALYIFEPSDPRAVRRVLVTALTDEEAANAKTRLGLERVSSYAWSGKARRIAAVYDLCLSRSS